MAAKALLLLCLLGVAAVSVTAKAKKETFTLLLSYQAGEFNATDGYPDVTTSYKVWAGSVYNYKTLKFLGFSDGQTTVAKVRPAYKVFLAKFVYDFVNTMDSIVIDGISVTSDAVDVIAITGGTGKYKSASGQVQITNQTPLKLPTSVRETKVVVTVKF